MIFARGTECRGVYGRGDGFLDKMVFLFWRAYHSDLDRSKSLLWYMVKRR